MNQPIKGEDLIRRLEDGAVDLDMPFEDIAKLNISIESKMAMINARQGRIRRNRLKPVPDEAAIDVSVRALRADLRFLFAVIEQQDASMTKLRAINATAIERASRKVGAQESAIKKRDELLDAAAAHINALEKQLLALGFTGQIDDDAEPQEQRGGGIVLATDKELRAELNVRRAAGALTSAERKVGRG